MPSLAALNAQLIEIRKQLAQSPVFLMGRPLEAEQAEREQRRLEKIDEQLCVIKRELLSSASLIALQKKALPRSLERDQRWQVAQSLAQRGENVRAVFEQAEGLARWLSDLLKKNGIISPMQMAKELTDLFENFEKSAENMTAAREAIQHVTAGPAYIPVPGPSAGGIPELHPLVPPTTFAILAIRWFRKHRDAGRP